MDLSLQAHPKAIETRPLLSLARADQLGQKFLSSMKSLLEATVPQQVNVHKLKGMQPLGTSMGQNNDPKLDGLILEAAKSVGRIPYET